jgi:serine protease inhibitor
MLQEMAFSFLTQSKTMHDVIIRQPLRNKPTTNESSMNITAILISLILLAIAQGCSIRGAKGSKRTILEREKSVVVKSIDQTERSSSTFGTTLFSKVCDSLPTNNNVLVSPLSVYQALSLVKDGATIGSDNELEMVTLLSPPEAQDHANMLQKLAEQTNSTSDVQLSMATSIWTDGLKQSYIEAAKVSQSAETFPLPETFTPVDDWIENKTMGMIPKMMGDEALDPLTRALLVNAVHFKGAWTKEFDPKDTVKGPFSLLDGSKVTAQYMKDSRVIKAAVSSPSLGGASFVALDYGNVTEPEFSSLFILPATGDEVSLDDAIHGLNTQSILDLLEEASEIDVRLQLPRFRIDFGPSQLKPMLFDMGMTLAFDPNVLEKFNQMTFDPYLYIKDVYHGACMEVTEEGTEAAAATVVIMLTRAMPRQFRLTFDRPFIVVVLHHRTGMPLFIGKIANPDFI